MTTPTNTTTVTLDDGTSLAVQQIEPQIGPQIGPGSQPALIWGHGLSSSIESEDALGLIEWSVAAPDHRVIRYDARSHGASDSTDGDDDHRWDRLARDQLALADALGIERYVAAGASMGAATALHAAFTAPDRVDRLVLVIPPTAWETRAEQVALYATIADLVEAGRIDLLLAGVDQSPAPDPFADREDWRQRTKDTLRRSDPVRLARVMRGAGRGDLPSDDELRTIDAPALILAWTGDPGHPVSTAERLVESLPDAELHLASSPEELATWSTIVAAFLDG